MVDLSVIKKTVNDIVLKYKSKSKRISQEDSSELSNAIDALLDTIKEKKTITKRIQVLKIVESIIYIVLNSSIQNVHKLVSIMIEIGFSDLSSITSLSKKLKGTATKEQYDLLNGNIFKKIFDFIKSSKIEVKEPILSKFHDKLRNIKNKNFFIFDLDKIIVETAEYYLNDTPKNKLQRQIITNIYKKTIQNNHLLSVFCKLNDPFDNDTNINFIIELRLNIEDKVKDVISFNDKIHISLIGYIEEKIINNTKMNKHCLKNMLDSFEFMYINKKGLFLDEYVMIIFDTVYYLYNVYKQDNEEYLCINILNTLRNIKNENQTKEHDSIIEFYFIENFLRELLEGLNFESFVKYSDCSMALFALYNGKETNNHIDLLNRELFVYCDGLYHTLRNILFLFIKREDKIDKDVKFYIFNRILDMN